MKRDDISAYHGDYVLTSVCTQDYSLDNLGEKIARLYVPPRLAHQLNTEGRATRAALIKQRDEESRLLEVQSAKAAKTHAPGGIRPSASKEKVKNEVARFCTLPGEAQMVQRLLDMGAWAADDGEAGTRVEFALKRAVEPGSSRAIVRNQDWRSNLRDLEAEMPAFRRVIDIVRNAHALSEATQRPPLIPPILMVGEPGIGKSHFCRRLIAGLGIEHRWLGFDNPSAGSQLRGSDKHWGNSQHGALFDLLALGLTANPAVVLDEIDKAPRRQTSQDVDPLAQLYGVLERETSRHLLDVSLEVELDASLVMYLATANGLKGLDDALLSRFEVVKIDMPSQQEVREAVPKIVSRTLEDMGVAKLVRFTPGTVVVLAECSPRRMIRVVQKLVAQAILKGITQVTHLEVEVELGLSSSPTGPDLALH